MNFIFNLIGYNVQTAFRNSSQDAILLALVSGSPVIPGNQDKTFLGSGR